MSTDVVPVVCCVSVLCLCCACGLLCDGVLWYVPVAGAWCVAVIYVAHTLGFGVLDNQYTTVWLNGLSRNGYGC